MHGPAGGKGRRWAMIWRRTLLLGLVVVTGLLLETTLLGATTLGGTRPELVLLATVALAMEEGAALGAFSGFVGGLVTDLLLSAPRGLSALTFTIVGYSVGSLREQIETPTAWLPIIVAALATLVGVFLYGGVSVLFGQAGFSPALLARRAALAAAYNALLAPFVVPLVRRLAVRLRPRTVVRL